MKIFSTTLLLFIVIILSCKKETKTTEVSSPKKVIEKETVPTTQKEITDAIYYVNAASGLNYRNAPNGDILGKLLNNTEVKISEYTNQFTEIKDGENVLKGEWVGINVNKDDKTVYVFNAFISPFKMETDKQTPKSNPSQKLNIYNLDSYEISKGNTVGFVSLSDSFYPSEHKDSLVIAKEYLGSGKIPDHFTLSKPYRKRFLQQSGISETDNIYIYNYIKDTLVSLKVKSVPVFGHITPYGTGGRAIRPYDYYIGFSFQDHLNLDLTYNSSFIYVGKENPFNTGALTPIIWTQIEENKFPQVPLSIETIGHLKRYIKHNTSQNKTNKTSCYSFALHSATYYYKEYNRARHFVAMSKNNKILHNEVLFEGESMSFARFTYAGETNQYEPEQWTGKLFKNKPAVMFGFCYESFGCSSIDVLDITEPAIGILCDNRH